MTFSFRPGVRENVGLLIGLIGPTGSGKTYTAMELATGIAGGKPFAFIDTEARRGLHYADHFRIGDRCAFDHGELGAPFRPDAYLDAIRAADKAGYPVIVVDSMSHEHAGDGGLLEWHDEEFKRMGSRDAMKMLAWVKPKMSHKKMVARLLQIKAHIILCFRAEEKIKVLPDPDKPGKTKPTSIGFQPICEKNLPFELTCSLLFSHEAPGKPIPLKLQEQHKHLFPPDKVVAQQSGRAIAEWAGGGQTARPGPTADRGMIDHLIETIAAADGIDRLNEIGAELKDITLSEADHKRAKAAWLARKKEI